MNRLDLTLATPAQNLACDEALLDWCEEESGLEILRFWEPAAPFVVVGYANHVEREVNLSACAAAHLPVLRRCTGGGTVLQSAGILNYSLLLRIQAPGPTSGIHSTNQFILERHQAALTPLLGLERHRKPGAPLQIQGHTDLAIGNLKISGNAQRRRKDFLLFHGTFLLDCDLTQFETFLKMPAIQPPYREGRTHLDFTTTLAVPAAAAKRALAEAWRASKKLETVPHERIESLTRDKYVTDRWNFKF